ncbi:MAG: dicarboxylate transporter/tellurite-resistance protein TehA [Burkholderiales bacterium]|nr:dicarboxylate transporter/tellurite-resistance protein TehA [Burkholderiales bacterium]
MTAHRAPVPVSFFSIPVGLLAFANTWHVGVRLWHLSADVAQAFTLAGLAVWVALLALYARKWFVQRAEAVAELRHPLQSAFAALLPVSSMLASVALIPFSRGVATGLFVVAFAGQLALGLALNGRLWTGGRPPELVTPAIYLPSVAQGFVAATASAAFGWQQLGMMFFGAGLLAWLALESLILQRAAVGAPLPVALRPLLGIQLAPAVVGGGSWLALTTGTPDMLAWLLLGYGLYQALLLLRLLPWIREQAFVPGYWAFSFGSAALPALAMRMVERGATGLVAGLAPVLFVAANLVFALLIAGTLRMLARGTLLPLISPAPATTVR